jgi:hypothetical protein
MAILLTKQSPFAIDGLLEQAWFGSHNIQPLGVAVLHGMAKDQELNAVENWGDK